MPAPGEVNPPQPVQAPVFKDRIPSSQAPAAIGSATPEQAMLKQEAVVQSYEQRATELSPLVGAQPSPLEVGQRVESTEQAVTTATQALEQTSHGENVVAERGLNRFGIVRRSMGNRTATEQANDIAQANAALAKAEALRTQAQGDLKASQMYSNEYIAMQTDPARVQELIEANKHGGPMTVSREMTQALTRQDEIQRDPHLAEKRFYRENGYDVAEDKMLPIEVFTGMKALVGKDYHHQEADVDRLTVMMAAVNEVALEYADAHALSPEQQHLVASYDLGQRITDGVSGSGFTMAYDFAIQKLDGETPWSTGVGYYTIGAAQLNNFFNKHQIPEGEARVPYILAYTSGALANGVPMYLGPISRDWLADALPCERTETVRRDGSWVEESRPAMPRGLGSFIIKRDDPESSGSWTIQREGTTDRGLADVMKKAGDIVRSVYEKFKERRVDYSVVQHFDTYKIVDPPVRTPQETPRRAY